MKLSDGFWRFSTIALGWAILSVAIIVGLYDVASAFLYGGTDGHWAAWNALSILRNSQYLDPSPFNAYSGLGSIFLPNLPWLNPGALALSVPADLTTRYVSSYFVYFLEVSFSVVVLARVIGLPSRYAHFAGQLYALVIFVPFNLIFNHLEWYSAAPVYAHMTSMLNLLLAMFIVVGNQQSVWRNGAFVILAVFFSFSAAVSGPFIFPFFALPYVFLGLAVFVSAPRNRTEFGWKIGLLLAIPVFLLVAGYFDYLVTTVATAARTPSSSPQWDILLSPGKLLTQISAHSICSKDPRALICTDNSIYWFSMMGLLGALYYAARSSGLLRFAALAYVVYAALTHFYAYVYQLSLIGSASVLSTHFVSWSAYPYTAVMLTGVLALFGDVVRAFRTGTENFRSAATWIFSVLFVAIIVSVFIDGTPFDPHTINLIGTSHTPNLFWVWWWTVVAVFLAVVVFFFSGTTRNATLWISNWLRTRIGPQIEASMPFWRNKWVSICTANLLVLAVPIVSLTMLPDFRKFGDPLPSYSPGIVKLVREETGLELGSPFRGYVSTVWASEERGHWRYIVNRDYYKTRFGTTFIENDLWNQGIPTFEEYGQWVSRQAQAYAGTMLADSPTQTFGTFLRIYRINTDILRSLGIRYVITNEPILGDSNAREVGLEFNGDKRVFLFELANPNTGNFSPTDIVEVEATEESILLSVWNNASRLETQAFVTERPESAENLTPAQDVQMTLEPDGYRIEASSAGRSAILLPIQFSHCLTVTKVHSGQSPTDVMRANYLQTLIVFENELDISLEFEFGFFGSTDCRADDARDLERLKVHPKS